MVVLDNVHAEDKIIVQNVVAAIEALPCEDPGHQEDN